MQIEVTKTLLEKIPLLPLKKQQDLLIQVETVLQNETLKKSNPLQRLGQIIDEAIKDVPREALEKLPTDGSRNTDHYLYGASKE